jgi:hypothetical protein
MKSSFSLNNFSVSPSVSNPGDCVSKEVLSLSHQNEKNQKSKKKTKTQQSVQSSDAIQFQ